MEGSQYLLMRYFFNLLQGLLNCEKNEFQLGYYSRFLLHCKELIGDRLLFSSMDVDIVSYTFWFDAGAL